MKIYFAGSIRAGRDDQELYHRIIQGLQRHGQVLTVHVGDRILPSGGTMVLLTRIFMRGIWLGSLTQT